MRNFMYEGVSSLSWGGIDFQTAATVCPILRHTSVTTFHSLEVYQIPVTSDKHSKTHIQKLSVMASLYHFISYADNRQAFIRSVFSSIYEE